ncbi:MAG: 2-phospho-L-lactate guanylyltransferase [Miltoncostaeaceae bacterium]
MSAERCVAVVPVKPMATALGRLADVLDPGERHALQGAMLHDVLLACEEAAYVAATVVVTSDPAAEAVTRALGAAPVADHVPPRGMNEAVNQGLRAAKRWRADTALVLTADLPLIRSADLDRIGAHPGNAAVVLAPSRDGTGTNAMLLRPPSAIEPALGPDSLARHIGRAMDRGLPWDTVALPSVALDIDTPDDLAALRAEGAGTCAGEVLASIEWPAAAGSSH